MPIQTSNNGTHQLDSDTHTQTDFDSSTENRIFSSTTHPTSQSRHKKFNDFLD